MLQTSPCKGCKDRKGLECKKTCKKWQEFEQKKEAKYEASLKTSSDKSYLVESRIRSMKREK